MAKNDLSIITSHVAKVVELLFYKAGNTAILRGQIPIWMPFYCFSLSYYQKHT